MSGLSAMSLEVRRRLGSSCCVAFLVELDLRKVWWGSFCPLPKLRDQRLVRKSRQLQAKSREHRAGVQITICMR